MSWLHAVASAAVLAVAMPAAADMIASPPIGGGGTSVYCSVFNIGQSPLPVAYIDIWRADGVLVSHASPCGTAAAPNLVQPGTMCMSAYHNPDGQEDNVFSCRVTLTGKANARGSIELNYFNEQTTGRAELW